METPAPHLPFLRRNALAYRIVLLCAVAIPAHATTITVTNTNDSGAGSLRQALADAGDGNFLALFPSYAFLSEVTGRMRLRNKRVLVQRQADSDAERDILLQALRSAVFGDILLVAVAGGVFAEGVDYPGEVLKAVASGATCRQ